MKRLIACWVCLSAAGCLHTEPARYEDEVHYKFHPDKDAVPVSVKSLQYQLVLGHLGVPLGTVVRVTGEAVDGDTYGRAKFDQGQTLLRIRTVNGGNLPKPVLFVFQRTPESVKKPAVGDKFDYYVHEYGEWDGVVEPPEELGIPKLGLDHDGFHYRRRLTIHASNPVPK